MTKKLLTKEEILYDRDDNGELVGREVPVEIDETDNRQHEYEGSTVIVKPIPRGALKKLFSDETFNDKTVDIDAEIIAKYVVNPSIEKHEVEFMKPALVIILVNTVLRESGVSNKSKYSKKSETSGSENNKAVVEDAEDDFAKN